MAPRQKKKKKNLGREKTKGACEKGPVRGHAKKPPSQTEKALDAGRPWVPGPTGNKICRQNPTKRGVHSPAQRRTPWPSLGRGAGETTFTGLVRPPPVILEKVWPQNKRGKEKQNKRNTRKPLPPRVPRKRPQKVQGESQKRPGPRMAPRKNAKKRDARPKRAEQTKAAGHKKKKNQKNRCVCGGVLLLPELCLLKKRKNKKKPKTTTTTKKPKEERTNPEKTRPDKKRIFPNSFGSETPKNKAKTIAKTHQKTQDQHNHPKTKVRSRKFFQKTTLRKEKNDKKRQKTPDQTRKTQNEKNGQHFPLRKGGNRHKNLTVCDSTVAGPCKTKMPPPPSWAVLYSVRQEGGGGGETDGRCRQS